MPRMLFILPTSAAFVPAVSDVLRAGKVLLEKARGSYGDLETHLRGDVTTFGGDEITAVVGKHPFLASAFSSKRPKICLFCKGDLDSRWWEEQEAQSYLDNFESVSWVLPCCHKMLLGSEARRIYDDYITRLEIAIEDCATLSSDDLQLVGRILGCEIRQFSQAVSWHA